MSKVIRKSFSLSVGGYSLLLALLYASDAIADNQALQMAMTILFFWLSVVRCLCLLVSPKLGYGRSSNVPRNENKHRECAAFA